MKRRGRARLVAALSLMLAASCGPGLGPALDSASSSELPSGAVVQFDATQVSGTGSGFPASGCAVLTWSDLSPNGNDGAVSGCGAGGWTGTGIPADPYRLYFDGANLRVTTSLNAQPSVMLETTWVAWVRPTRVNHGSEQHLFSIDNHAGAFNRSLLVHAGTSNFGMFVGGAVTYEPTTVDSGVWQHVAGIFSASDLTFYKNGTPTSRGSAPSYVDTVQTLSIGASNNGVSDRFQGDIAWLAVYDRALTATEVRATCTLLKARYESAVCN